MCLLGRTTAASPWATTRVPTTPRPSASPWSPRTATSASLLPISASTRTAPATQATSMATRWVSLARVRQPGEWMWLRWGNQLSGLGWSGATSWEVAVKLEQPCECYLIIPENIFIVIIERLCMSILKSNDKLTGSISQADMYISHYGNYVIIQFFQFSEIINPCLLIIFISYVFILTQLSSWPSDLHVEKDMQDIHIFWECGFPDD